VRRKAERELQRKLRRRILKRDGYRCRACGSGENLEMAHVYGREAPPEKRWSERSLLTLCHGCHRIFDLRWRERDAMRISSAEDAVRFLRGELRVETPYFLVGHLWPLERYLESRGYKVRTEALGNYEYEVAVSPRGEEVVLKQRSSPSSSSLVEEDLRRLAAGRREVLYLLDSYRLSKKVLSLLLSRCDTVYIPSVDEEGFSCYLRVGEPQALIARELERLFEGRVRGIKGEEVADAPRQKRYPLLCSIKSFRPPSRT
jgi:hypothetical protein